jgi:hypothetical protein
VKLTKSKLKEIIKEELNDIAEQDEDAAPGRGNARMRAQWEIELEKIMEAGVRLYEEMPLEGKEALTANFEKYAKHYAYKTREFSGDRPSWMREGADDDEEEEFTKIVTEVKLAPAIFKQMKAAGTLPAGATIDFAMGQGGGQSKQASPQKPTAAPQQPAGIAASQALAGKLGKQAAQFIMSKLDDNAKKTLAMMLRASK